MTAAWVPFGATGNAGDAFAYPIEDYYRTDSISRASPTMAACAESYIANTSPKTGTHG